MGRNGNKMRNSIECSRVNIGFQNLSGMGFSTIALILITLIFSDIEAQFIPKSYLKGYIVTSSEDTIRGNIEQKAVYTSVIKYKLQENDKAIKIKLKEVKYLKIGNTLYHNVRYRKQYHLMKEVIRGPISLLSLPTPAIPNNPNPLTSLQNKPDYYLIKNGIVQHVDKEKYYQKTALYFSDFEHLREKIGNKEYTYDDLVEIVLKYNYWYNYKRPSDK
jgi:hypothetical protein